MLPVSAWFHGKWLHYIPVIWLYVCIYVSECAFTESGYTTSQWSGYMSVYMCLSVLSQNGATLHPSDLAICLYIRVSVCFHRKGLHYIPVIWLYLCIYVSECAFTESGYTTSQWSGYISVYTCISVLSQKVATLHPSDLAICLYICVWVCFHRKGQHYIPVIWLYVCIYMYQCAFTGRGYTISYWSCYMSVYTCISVLSRPLSRRML